MIGKHVDLIAIAVLLCGIGVYSCVRNAVIVHVQTARGIVLTHRPHHHVVVIPDIPRIPLARD